MSRALTLALVGALALHAGCDTLPPTEIMVRVDSDIPLSQLQSARIRVTRADDPTHTLFSSTCVCLGAGSGCKSLPLTLGVIPSSEMLSAPFTVVATGYGDPVCQDGDFLVEQSATVSFVSDQTLELDLHLISPCIGVKCMPGYTCKDASRQCLPNDAGNLPPFGSDLGAPDFAASRPVDFAGRSDGSALDASHTTDGATPDLTTMSPPDSASDASGDLAMTSLPDLTVDDASGDAATFQPDLTVDDAASDDLTMIAMPDLAGGDMPMVTLPDLFEPDLTVLDSDVEMSIGDMAIGPKTIAFRLTPFTATTVTPLAIAAGDINGDGQLDVVTAAGNGITYLRNSNGALLSPSNLGGAPGATGVALGDFTGDNKIDAVVGSAANDTVVVMSGTGTSLGGTQKSSPAGGQPGVLVAGYIDSNEANLDVAAVLPATNQVAVLLGDGSGGFAAPKLAATDARPIALEMVDLNGDSDIDIAVACNSATKVSLLAGNGDGTMTALTSLDTGANNVALATADFNADTFSDIAVARVDGTVRVFYGDGTGAFPGQIDLKNTAIQLTALTAADVDGDGATDLVLVGNAVEVLYGQGDGTFPRSSTWAAGDGPVAVVAAQLDGNGIADLAVADKTLAGVSVLHGQSGGTFDGAPALWFAPSGYFTADRLVTAQLDNLQDTTPDILLGVPGSCDGFAIALLGNGDGTFHTVVKGGLGWEITSFAIADFNSDGANDFAAPLHCGVRIPCYGVFTNDSTGNAFGYARDTTNGPDTALAPSAVGDFTGDGQPDFLLGGNSGINLFANNNGVFPNASTMSLSTVPTTALAVADLNGDGLDDIVASTTNSLNVMIASMSGGFVVGNYPVVAAPNKIVLVDLNNDGGLDLVASTPSGVAVALATGFQTGLYKTPVTVAVGQNTPAVQVGDFNLDTIPDLALDGGTSFAIYAGKGDGTFQAPVTFRPGFTIADLASGDFDNDGRPDLAAAFTGGEATFLNLTM